MPPYARGRCVLAGARRGAARRAAPSAAGCGRGRGSARRDATAPRARRSRATSRRRPRGPRLPGVRDQEHDARRRRRPDRRRGGRRAGRLSRAHRRHPARARSRSPTAATGASRSPRPQLMARAAARAAAATPTAASCRPPRAGAGGGWPRRGARAPAARRSSGSATRRRRRPAATDGRGRRPVALARRRSTACQTGARGRAVAGRGDRVGATQPGYAMPAAALGGEVGRPGAVGHARRDPGRDARRDRGAQAAARSTCWGRRGAVSRRACSSSSGSWARCARIAGADPVAERDRLRALPDGASAGTSSIPGHGLVFASPPAPARRGRGRRRCRPAAPTGRCCSLTDADALPPALQGYLLDIQPGYDQGPGARRLQPRLADRATRRRSRVDVQARIDTLLEIQPVERTGAPTAPWPKPSSPSACAREHR